MKVIAFLILASLFYACQTVQPEKKPNIILILTDDQGYGDVGYHNNPHIHTPAIDSLANDGIRLTNFYVSPRCAPTRAALLTGKYPGKTGVFHVTDGGYNMAQEEITIAEYFKDAGYATAICGKWHIGDHYPYMPSDQGFDFSLIHKGEIFEGGVRVPAFINYAQLPKNKKVNLPVAHYDVLPTLAELCGLSIKKTDDVSFLPALNDDSESIPYRPLIIRETNYMEPYRHIMIRKGDFKLVASGWFSRHYTSHYLMDVRSSGYYNIKLIFRDTISEPGKVEMKFGPVGRAFEVDDVPVAEVVFDDVLLPEDEHVMQSLYQNGKDVISPFYVIIEKLKN